MNTKDSFDAARSSVSPGQGGGDRLHPVEWARESGSVDDILQEMDVRVRRLRRRRAGMMAAACVSALLLAVVGWQFVRPAKSGGDTASPSAIVARPPQQHLPDGSVVELKPGAEIGVEYSDTLRRLVLKRGEAHFQVAKDASKPFIVQAGTVKVRAVGTAFSVEFTPSMVDVLVSEGQVAVEKEKTPEELAGGEREGRGGPPMDSVETLVSAGNQVTVDLAVSHELSSLAVKAVPSIVMAERMSWRVPRLEFTASPLAQVIPMINQHSGVRLSLGDPSLETVVVSGVLRADNIGTLLRLLEEEHGIKADRLNDSELVLRKLR